MSILLSLLGSRAGLLAMAAAAVFVFYEGVPIGPLRSIPLLGPVLEEITGGRVDRERRAARDGFVRETGAIAAEAKAAEVARQLEAGRRAAARYAKLLAERILRASAGRIGLPGAYGRLVAEASPA